MRHLEIFVIFVLVLVTLLLNHFFLVVFYSSFLVKNPYETICLLLIFYLNIFQRHQIHKGCFMQLV